MNNEILEKAIIQLFEVERFYSEIILRMNRKITKRVDTAGVNITNEGINLYINPEFFQRMTLQSQVGILIHECQHLLHDHIPRSKELQPEVYEYAKNKKRGYFKNVEEAAEDFIIQQKHSVLNIAMDCAINSLNIRIPEKFEVFDGKEWKETSPIFPKQFDLQEGQSFEWYFENLKNNEKAKQMNTIDDHSLWAESEGDKEILKEKVRQIINQAAKATRAVGKMSAYNELLVDKLNHNPRNWKSDLRRFVARNNEVYLDTSRKKRNRRYGVLFPGVIKEERLHIGVAVDTSGSVPDEALSQFLAEIGNIAKQCKVTVIEADCEVKNVYEFDPKKPIKMMGRGGTAYNPALEKFEELEIDGCIYFGDGDVFGEEIKKPSYPVIWAIYGPQEKPADFGYYTKVEINHK